MLNILRRSLIIFPIGLILVGTFLMFQITIPYFSLKYDIGFLLTKQAILHVDIWRWSFYTHITSSIIVLLIGVFQFIPFFLAKYPLLHRTIGKTYIVLVLFFCAPSGLVMGFYANGGLLSKMSFVCLSLSWWILTFMAYQKIKQRNIKSHVAFMYRSYALTISALTFRLYVLILPLFMYLPAKEMYTLIAWLSWIPNLLIIEIWLKLRANKLITSLG